MTKEDIRGKESEKGSQIKNVPEKCGIGREDYSQEGSSGGVSTKEKQKGEIRVRDGEQSIQLGSCAGAMRLTRGGSQEITPSLERIT